MVDLTVRVTRPRRSDPIIAQTPAFILTIDVPSNCDAATNAGRVRIRISFDQRADFCYFLHHAPRY